MNRILFAGKSRNHIRMFCLPADKWNLPLGEKEQTLWAQAEYNKLVNSETAKREFIKTNRRRGYMISVWMDCGVNYLVQSIRNEFGTYNNTIYALKGELNDALAIAKFLASNCESIMSDYKKQIKDAGKDYIERSNKDVEEKTEG